MTSFITKGKQKQTGLQIRVSLKRTKRGWCECTLRVYSMRQVCRTAEMNDEDYSLISEIKLLKRQEKLQKNVMFTIC